MSPQLRVLQRHAAALCGMPLLPKAACAAQQQPLDTHTTEPREARLICCQTLCADN
jgi:hypothetical protein